MAYIAERRQILDASYLRFPQSFVAGGAVTSVFTGQKINDVDVYFKSRAAFEHAVFDAYDEGMWCVAASKRAVTFAQGDAIMQLMHFDFFPRAADIFKAFDYTIVMGALDMDAVPKARWNGAALDFGDEPTDSGFVFHPDFMKHNAQRFLRFNPATRYPIASTGRVLKYQQRGYTIGKGDMMKIALAARTVKLETWEDLKDQIGGAYGNKVALGNEDTPFSIPAAIEALTVENAEDEPWEQRDQGDTPANAEACLRHLASLNGGEWVPQPQDEHGWPVLSAGPVLAPVELPLAA